MPLPVHVRARPAERMHSAVERDERDAGLEAARERVDVARPLVVVAAVGDHEVVRGCPAGAVNEREFAHGLRARGLHHRPGDGDAGTQKCIAERCLVHGVVVPAAAGEEKDAWDGGGAR